MITFIEAFRKTRVQLQPLYDEREATAISHELMSYITGLDTTKLLLHKQTLLNQEQQQEFDNALIALTTGRPLQYVLGYTWFMGRKFMVNDSVLIPRPETEELIMWVIDNYKNKESIAILDVGTGSGCIPIMLKLLLPHATVTSCDISNAALDTANDNAIKFKAIIELLHTDFLAPGQTAQLGMYNMIISNPPYIPLSEKHKLHQNVTDYEPEIALFVPDENPLVFYKVIAAFGRNHLTPHGKIYCEIEQSRAEECEAIFEEAGYKNVTLKKDIHGNWRMIKCEL